MTIANEILAQLGGNRFLAMTGAKSLVDCGDALRFALPRGFAAQGIDRVEIKLTTMDVYELTFGKWNGRKLEVAEVSKSSGVYAEDLRRFFSGATGLDCTMGRA
ncbi:hypothetical protein [Mesorhizobium sp. M6A.T.Cr.TU.016.01.1.1]|uniref:hypothetical protein n=1 Tax=Mesorhizobium sp. M6A.T.Cr.TU.016.01.1.1 TaxID=2493677 RepID=UPI000F75CA57|nr:hypothetical protein [Mesorhizobium sp. M6A.T.Cr.TU.016.01.1.1]AZO67666.1 hypothetical protein EJ075_23920 [Mesorhizobium sp. M6A.T.Cr.TU.016.01.1.1]